MTVHKFRFRRPLSSFVCVTLAACASDAVTGQPEVAPPTKPDIPTPPTKPDTAAPVQPLLPLFKGDIVVYERVSPSSSGVASRYVLFPDGAFSVEYLRTDATKLPIWFSYRGYSVRAASLIELAFNGTNTAAGWAATAAIRGDSLIVDYNDVMEAAGFEDGVYGSSATSPPPTGEHVYIGTAAGSGHPLRLARGGWPTFSPDGRRIAFNRDGQICLIDIDGSNESCIGAGWSPTWGQRIAFANADGIAVMNADGSDVRTLVRHNFRTDTYAPSDLGVGEPAWSPDGQSIAFEHLGDAETQVAQIFVARADGSDVRMLTEPLNGARYVERHPVWSAKGDRILFSSGFLGIGSVQASGGLPVSLYSAFPLNTFPSRPTPSPDGLVVAYTLRDRTTGAQSVWATGYGQLIVDGHDPDWSPEGKYIVYARGGQ